MTQASRFLVYGLIDPRDGQVRYVGKSTTGRSRADEHGYPSSLAKERSHKRNSLGGDGLLGCVVTPSVRREISLSNMEAKRKINPIEEAALCARYLAGETTYQLSEAFGIERHTVARWLRKNGVDVRKKDTASRRRIAKSAIADVVAAYAAGASTTEIARQYSTYCSNVHRTLRAAGVVLRTKSEAIRLANARRGAA